MRKISKDAEIAVINTKLDGIKDDVIEIKGLLKDDYVTKEEFDPIKKLVYGLVGLILAAVVGGLLALVITKQ